MSSSNIVSTTEHQLLSDATYESFWLGESPDDAEPSLADNCESSVEIRDASSTEHPKTTSDDLTRNEVDTVVDQPERTADQPQAEKIHPQAMLMFIMGVDCFSGSYELGVLDEHPQALDAITSNPCLSASAYLKPALDAAIVELRPSLMLPIAVRLAAISLRLASRILLSSSASTPYEDISGNEEKKLAELVQDRLDQAVPHYQWQGSRNHCGRIQYVMALTEEAIQVMAVSRDSLATALSLDGPAVNAAKCVVQSVLELNETLEEVCGAWAAKLTLSACGSQKDYDFHPCSTPVAESDDELPSPSEFVRKKLDAKAARLVPRVKAAAPEAAGNDSFKFGSAEEPLCISDSEPEHPPPTNHDKKSSRPTALRHSFRNEALKRVDYNTKRHPQDAHLPAARKQRRLVRRCSEDAGLEH